MDKKIFLESNRSEFSNNVENALDVAFSTNVRLLPNNSISDEFSLFQQYNRERDNCNRFRLILNVNPVCSNILFNARTEIVLDEGSSGCTLLIGNTKIEKPEKAVNTKTPIDYYNAIQNTEYSHKDNGGFVYHCGYDIFNNHMLRKKDFIHVNQLNNSSISQGEKYNTIFDYNRDGRGNIIEEEIHVKRGKNGTKVKMHLYQYDSLMSMSTAFMDNCIEKDGWWGFTNPGTIEIPNSSAKTTSINRMMANNKSCEFIDLYPDRSLFSFIPKFNKFRKRSEKNWDYCITYPFEKDYDKLNEVCGGEQQAIRANMKQVINSAGIPLIECSSYFKHNLIPGNFVTFYYYMPHYSKDSVKENGNYKQYKIDDVEYLFKEEDFDINGALKDDKGPNDSVRKIISKTFTRYSIKVKVESVGDVNGDSKDRIFSVKLSNISEIYDNMSYFGCFYKKNNGNTDCLYYFRKFKKLTNIDEETLRSDINKVAFGRNIYGDETAQVIFTDDIDVNGLLDHNGRPISEVFFTVVKRNAGYKEWYENKNYTGDTIEFSHCFGEITSAIDFCGIENEPFDYNVHFLHNLKKNDLWEDKQKNLTLSAWGETILSGTPKTIEYGITIDMNVFYGDIVEYDVSKAKETVIGNVYHRFNTAQREYFGEDFKQIKQDVITKDDYDYANGVGGTNENTDGFTVKTYYMNNVKNSLDTYGNGNTIMFGNISPEGYFYNPHMRISVKENDDEETTSPAKFINYTKPSLNFKIPHYELTLTVPVNYGFYKGDFIAFYDKKTSDVVWCEIIQVSGMEVTVTINKEDMPMVDNISIKLFNPSSSERRFYAYWSPNNTPTFAKLCEGQRKFVWRKIVPPSEMIQDDELYDIPFANGRFYIEKNINFFLKRQDPIGKYGLSRPMYKVYKQQVVNPLMKFVISGYKPMDFSTIMYTMNNLTTHCF